MRRRRKEQGLCTICAKPLDRNGALCSECLKKRNDEQAQTRHWYQEHGICPRCQKNPIMGDEKICPECLALSCEQVMKNRKKRPKEEYNKYMSEFQRRQYTDRVEKGICTRCGRRKTEEGYKTCKMCRAKLAEYRRIKDGKPDRKERFKQGLCYYCDNPIKDGYKVCEKHYQMNVNKARSQNAKKARENLPKFRYGKGVKMCESK